MPEEFGLHGSRACPRCGSEDRVASCLDSDGDYEDFYCFACDVRWYR